MGSSSVPARLSPYPENWKRVGKLCLCLAGIVASCRWSNRADRGCMGMEGTEVQYIRYIQLRLAISPDYHIPQCCCCCCCASIACNSKHGGSTAPLRAQNKLRLTRTYLTHSANPASNSSQNTTSALFTPFTTLSLYVVIMKSL